MVDVATCYHSTPRLLNETAAAIWSSFRQCWRDSYLGPPNVIKHDAGTKFSSREFAVNCYLMHIRLDPITKEAPQSMTTVGRQRASLRRAFLIIRKASPPAVEQQTEPAPFYRHFDDFFQMAWKVVNYVVGPDGFVPTLLIYCAMLRPDATLGQPHPTILARAQATRRATEELSTLTSWCKTRSELRSRHTPDATAVQILVLGSLEIVFCERLQQ